VRQEIIASLGRLDVSQESGQLDRRCGAGLSIEGISQSKQECHSTAMRNQINSRAP